ncbi:MAG: hypothetical protein H6723_05035 [Sandaracinus sp.]|nr:hypothetical protein [Sandaracinus sp.]
MISTQDVAATIGAYTQSARFRASHCTPLALQLARVAPAALTDDQRRALDTVQARATEVETIRKVRQRVSGPSLQRPRNATATAWTALATSLGALSTTPPELGPQGPNAAALVATLFPEGTSFGQQDASAVWSHSKMLLERIAEEGHRPTVDSLVSPVLLRAIEKAHAELGRAIGVSGDLVELPARRGLADALARFNFAVSAYARALSIGIDETTDEAFETFKAALAPVDAFRIARGVSSDADVEEEEDVDPVDPAEDPDAPYVPASDDPIDNPFIR